MFPKKLIVTGTQRSGTTLVHRILHAEGSYFCQNEIDDLNDIAFDNRPKNKVSKGSIALTKIESSLNVNLNPKLSASTPSSILDAALNNRAKLLNRLGWCIKDPKATYFLNEYEKAFPDARFIIIFRDPRAVCRSYLDYRTFNLGRPTNLIAAALRWCREVELQLSFANSNPSKTLLLNYEDLVIDFEPSCRKIAQFAGIHNIERMLSYYLHQDAGTEIHAGNQNIMLPPNPELIEKWRANFSEKQISQIESITGKAMKRLGYTAIGCSQKISFFLKLYSILSDKIQQEMRWQLAKKKSKTRQR